MDHIDDRDRTMWAIRRYMRNEECRPLDRKMHDWTVNVCGSCGEINKRESGTEAVSCFIAPLLEVGEIRT